MTWVVEVQHTVQMAHRLWNLPGKCQNLHGHTWRAVLYIQGDPDENGIVIDFHMLKAFWRNMLDTQFDHRLVLDRNDPILLAQRPINEYYEELYPGLQEVPFHPTVENLAQYWGQKARNQFFEPLRIHSFSCELHEGDLNAATWTG